MLKPTKIIWAVDAFTENKELHKKCSSVIKSWVKETGATVEPVVIMSPDQIKVPAELFANIRKNAEESALAKVKALLKSVNIPGLLKPTYLASSSYSLSKAVQTLLDYAKTTETDLIVASTQSRKGVTRFLFGSFAETLVLRSDVPILLVSPKTQVKKSFSHLLYATDLSDKAEESFYEALQIAESRKLRLTIFNKVEYFTDYTSSSLINAPLYEKYIDENTASRKATLEAMASEARNRGLEVDIVLDKNRKIFSASEAILKAAKKCKADVIAMASQTGPVETALLGSVTRQVIRSSSCPLWIIHSKRQSNAKKNAVKQSFPKKGWAIA